MAPRLADAGVDAWVRGLEGASDHAPTWISFDAEAARKKAARPKATARKP